MSTSKFLAKWKQALSGNPEKIFMKRIHTLAPQHKVEMAEDFIELKTGSNTAASRLAQEILQSA